MGDLIAGMDTTDRELARLRQQIREARSAGNHSEADRLTDVLAAMDTRPPVAKPNRHHGWWLVVVPFVGVAAALAVAFGVGAYFAKRAGPAPERVPGEAIANCEQAIKARLNHPGSADFSLLGVRTAIIGSRYTVTTEFTAMNGFGARFKMRGACVFPERRATTSPEVTMTEI